MAVLDLLCVDKRLQRVDSDSICNSDASLSHAFTGREAAFTGRIAELQRRMEEAQRMEAEAHALAARSQEDLKQLSIAYSSLKDLQQSSPSAGIPASNLPLPYKLAGQRLWGYYTPL